MTQPIHGTVRQGRLELPELPQDLPSGDVVVVFVTEQLPDRLVQSDPNLYDKILEEMFAEMDLGFHMGGRPYAKREDLYDHVVDEVRFVNPFA